MKKKNIYKGHIPLKCFGQNFLVDQNVIKKIITLLQSSIDDLFIEVGPGLGELTQPLSNLTNKLFAIEIDSNLANQLKNIFFKKNVSIIQDDVLSFDFLDFFYKYKKLIRIFGNLPYNISTKLILKLLNYKNIFYDMHFMLQKEVAERFLAVKGTREYSRLTVIIQCYYDVIQLFNVSSDSFFPKPKINSCFIRLIPKKEINFSFKKMFMLKKVTKLAFQERRKMLCNSLSCILNYDTLIALGVNPCDRAQNLSVLEYIKLASYLTDCS